ncbi:hypothetical protein CJO84_19700 (plasmid) [Ralstonia solanacearum]|nr:hypothetical protein CJO84_19700 [Ralstonia solanacearum]
MTLHELSHAKELLRVAEAMPIRVRLLAKEEGEAYILSVFDKFKPWKKEGISLSVMMQGDCPPIRMSSLFLV